MLEVCILFFKQPLYVSCAFRPAILILRLRWQWASVLLSCLTLGVSVITWPISSSLNHRKEACDGDGPKNNSCILLSGLSSDMGKTWPERVWWTWLLSSVLGLCGGQDTWLILQICPGVQFKDPLHIRNLVQVFISIFFLWFNRESCLGCLGSSKFVFSVGLYMDVSSTSWAILCPRCCFFIKTNTFELFN